MAAPSVFPVASRLSIFYVRAHPVPSLQSVAHDRVELIYRRLLKEILRIVIS